MKKILAMVLALGMILCLAACAKTEEEEVLTLGGTLKKQFVEIVKGGETDPYTIAETIMANEAIEFMPMIMEIDPGTYIQGFNEGFEAEGYEKCVMFSPMVGSIPFLGYIFELSEGTNAEEFAKQLEENADLRWNICVSADETNTASEGSLVFFLMSPTSLEQEAPEENQDDVMDMPIDDEPASMPEGDAPMDAPAEMPVE